MKQICELDISLYSVVTQDIQVREVIITEERIAHIKERHPNDFENYVRFLPEIIMEPDYIVKSSKKNTAVVLKEIKSKGEKFKVILRLRVSSDPSNYQNSILSYWRIGETTWRKMIRNKVVLYIREDSCYTEDTKR